MNWKLQLTETVTRAVSESVVYTVFICDQEMFPTIGHDQYSHSVCEYTNIALTLPCPGVLPMSLWEELRLFQPAFYVAHVCMLPNNRTTN